MRRGQLGLLFVAAILVSSLLFTGTAKAFTFNMKNCHIGQCQVTACVSLSDVTGFVQKIIKWFSSVYNLLTGNIDTLIKNALSKLESIFGNLSLGSILKDLGDAFSSIGKFFGGIGTDVSKFVNNDIFGLFNDAVKPLANSLLSGLTGIPGELGTLIGKLGGGVASLFGSFDKISTTIQLKPITLSGISDLLSNIWTDLSHLASEISTEVASIVDSLGKTAKSANNVQSNAVNAQSILAALCGSPANGQAPPTTIVESQICISPTLTYVPGLGCEQTAECPQGEYHDPSWDIPGCKPIPTTTTTTTIDQTYANSDATSVLAKYTDICTQIAQYNSDVATLKNDFASILPLIGSIGQSFLAMPANIVSAQSLSQYDVMPSFSGTINACLMPLGPLNVGVKLMGLTSTIGMFTGMLGNIETKLAGYWFSGAASNTIHGQINGIASLKLSDGSTEDILVQSGSTPASFGFSDGGFAGSVTLVGPLAITGTKFSGQIVGTLSGTYTGPIVAQTNTAGITFTGTATGTLKNIAAAGTVSGTVAQDPNNPGSLLVSGVQIAIASPGILVTGASVTGTLTQKGGTPQSVSGFLSDASQTTLSHSISSTYIVSVSGTYTIAQSLMTLSGGFPVSSSTMSVGVLVAVQNVKNDLSQIVSLITVPCQNKYVTLTAEGSSQKISLSKLDLKGCSDILKANSNVQTEENKLVALIDNFLIGHINSAVVTMDNLAGSINKRFGTITKAIQLPSNVVIDSGTRQTISSIAVSLGPPLMIFSNSIIPVANDVGYLRSNIMRLNKPIGELVNNVTKAQKVLSEMTDPTNTGTVYYQFVHITKQVCALNGQGVIDAAINAITKDNLPIAQAVCNLLYAFQGSSQEINGDLSAITGIYIATISYDLQELSDMTLVVQDDMTSLQTNTSAISTSLMSMNTILNTNVNPVTGSVTLTPADCTQLTKDAMTIQASVNNLKSLAVLLPVQFNAFLPMLEHLPLQIWDTIKGIISELEDIFNTIISFLDQIKNALLIAQGNSEPIPNPGVCVSIAYVVQGTSFPAAGMGCVVNANRLVIAQAAIVGTATLSGTASAEVQGTQSISGTFKGTVSGGAGSTLQKYDTSVTVPVTVMVDGKAVATANIQVPIVGTLSLVYTGMSGHDVTATLIGTLTGTFETQITAAASLSATGTVGSSQLATALSGTASAGAGASESVSFSGSIEGSVTYSVSGTVGIIVNAPFSFGCTTLDLIPPKISGCSFKGKITANVGSSKVTALVTQVSDNPTMNSNVAAFKFYKPGETAFFTSSLKGILSRSEFMQEIRSVSVQVGRSVTIQIKSVTPTLPSVEAALIGGCYVKGIIELSPYLPGSG